MSSVWHIRPKPGEAAASLGAVLLERQVPVWRRALPEGPHRGIFLLLLHAGSFALAQRFLQEAQTAAAPRWALTPHGGGHPAVRRGGPGAGRYLRGGGAGALPGAAGGVIVPPAGAGRQLPVRVVVVEGVAQPAAVPPLPPVILARPRRLRGDRGESAGTGSAPPEPLGALRFPPAPLTLQLPPPAMLLPLLLLLASAPPPLGPVTAPPRPAPRAAGSRLPSARFRHRHPPQPGNQHSGHTVGIEEPLLQDSSRDRGKSRVWRFDSATRPPRVWWKPGSCRQGSVSSGRQPGPASPYACHQFPTTGYGISTIKWHVINYKYKKQLQGSVSEPGIP